MIKKEVIEWQKKILNHMKQKVEPTEIEELKEIILKNIVTIKLLKELKKKKKTLLK